MSDFSVIDDYISRVGENEFFPPKVERNLVFQIKNSIYQIRISQALNGEDFGLLMRWSLHKSDWSIIAKCKPGDIGYFAPNKAFNPEFFFDVEEDLISTAVAFEDVVSLNADPDQA